MVARAVDERDQLRAWLACRPVKDRWYETNAGQLVTHPAVTQVRALDAQLTSWLSLLGFSPSDRARLGLSHARAVTALDEYRARSAGRRAGPVDEVDE